MFASEQTQSRAGDTIRIGKQELHSRAGQPAAPTLRGTSMNHRLAAAALSVAAAFPFVFQTPDLQAQGYTAPRSTEPRIDGFDVAPVPRSIPGRELKFTLFGSPGGSAVVQIAGATGDLSLAEAETGVYEGIYTIRTRDHITAAGKATVNLRVGNKVSSMVLDEPLIAAANSGPTAAQRAAANGPRIEKFDVDAPASLAAGEELFLSLNGTPGGTATAQVTGVKGKLAMAEARPGVYEGSYTIRNRDRIATGSAVTATLRVRDRETTAALGRPLQPRNDSRHPARHAAQACVNCGVVESINQVQVKGEGTYLGKI